MSLLLRRVTAPSMSTSSRRPTRSIVARATYKVTLKTPRGDKVINCADDTYILDAAEEAGVDMDNSCRGGTCCACAGKVLSGSVDQSEQGFLDDKQMADGWVLTCVAYPTSDVVVLTDQAASL